PQDGPSTDFNHGLGFQVGLLGNSRSEAASQDDELHASSLAGNPEGHVRRTISLRLIRELPCKLMAAISAGIQKADKIHDHRSGTKQSQHQDESARMNASNVAH